MLKKKIIVKIDGMHCDHCKMIVENALCEIPNIHKVEVNLEKKKATITLKGEVNIEKIARKIEENDFVFLGIEE